MFKNLSFIRSHSTLMKNSYLAAIILSLTAFPLVGNAAIGITTPSVNSGELIRAADWNKIKLDLQTIAAALDALQNQSWASSGSDVFYNVGNVGIGTNSPTGKMHLYADAPVANATLLQLGTSDDPDRVRIDEDGDMTIDGKLVVRDSDIYESGGDLELSGEDSLYLSIDWNNNDADTQAILFGKNDDGAGIDFVELMRLDEGGNVGIGTDTPVSKLQVDRSIQLGSDAGACDAAKTGAMRFAGGAIERCDGTTWDALATTNVSDNLGSHVAEQNIDLGIFTLVGNGGTEGLTIAADGSVGIGVPAPTLGAKAEVRGGAFIVSEENANLARIAVLAKGTGDADLIFDAQNGDVSGGDYAWIGQKDDGRFFINNGGVDSLSVLQNGNVGIGDSAPDTLLQVRKTSPTANEVLLKVGTDADDNRFSVDEDGDVFMDGNQYVGGGNVLSGSGSITLGGEDNLYLAADWNNNDADSRSIIFGKNGVGAGAGWEELARIDEDGDMGIGVISPENKLHVVENTSTDRIATFENQATVGSPEGLLVLTGQGAGPAPAFAVGTGTEASHTNNFVVTNEGRVGIGITNPANELHISGSTEVLGNSIVVDASNHVTSNRASVQTGSWQMGQDYVGDGTRDFFIYDSNAGANRFFIEDNGNVGIGTTNPGSMLQVDGSINSTDGASTSGIGHLILKDGSGSASIQGHPSANGLILSGAVDGESNPTFVIKGESVGIGTADPERPLHVFRNAAAEVARFDHIGSTSFGIQIGDPVTPASNTGLYLRTQGMAQVAVGTGGDLELGVIDQGMVHIDGSTGNVGIGAGSPDEKLVVSSTTNTARIRLSSNTASQNAYWTVSNASGVARTTFGSGTVSEVIGFNNNNGEVQIDSISSDGTGKVVCIKGDGNLGTCTDAPDGTGACTCS